MLTDWLWINLTRFTCKINIIFHSLPNCLQKIVWLTADDIVIKIRQISRPPNYSKKVTKIYCNKFVDSCRAKVRLKAHKNNRLWYVAAKFFVLTSAPSLKWNVRMYKLTQLLIVKMSFFVVWISILGVSQFFLLLKLFSYLDTIVRVFHRLIHKIVAHNKHNKHNKPKQQTGLNGNEVTPKKY